MSGCFLRWWSCSLVLGCLSGCALLSKQSPEPTRYFTPQDDAVARPCAGSGRGLSLRLGRVSAAPSIRERIAHRTAQNEVHYYGDRRWNERPDVYLEQALSRMLFECQAMTLVVSGSAPTLQAELTLFEEVEDGPHRVRVQVTLLLHDAGRALVHQTLTVEKQVAEKPGGDAALRVAEAFSQALEGVVQQVSERTTSALFETKRSALEAH